MISMEHVNSPDSTEASGRARVCYLCGRPEHGTTSCAVAQDWYEQRWTWLMPEWQAVDTEPQG